MRGMLSFNKMILMMQMRLKYECKEWWMSRILWMMVIVWLLCPLLLSQYRVRVTLARVLELQQKERNEEYLRATSLGKDVIM